MNFCAVFVVFVWIYKICIFFVSASVLVNGDLLSAGLFHSRFYGLWVCDYNLFKDWLTLCFFGISLFLLQNGLWFDLCVYLVSFQTCWFLYFSFSMCWFSFCLCVIEMNHMGGGLIDKLNSKSIYYDYKYVYVKMLRCYD